MTPAASRPAASREVRSLLADPGAQAALGAAAAGSTTAAAAAATGVMSPPAASGAGVAPGGTPLGRCQLLSPVRAKRRDQEQLGAAGQVSLVLAVQSSIAWLGQMLPRVLLASIGQKQEQPSTYVRVFCCGGDDVEGHIQGSAA
jgi:hypothetical protein